MQPNEQPGAPAPEVPTVSAAELLTELPPAPPAAPSPAESVATPSADDPRLSERDSLNRPFDPAKFKHERDSLGRWKNARAGRKKESGAKTAAPAVPEIGPEETAAAPDAPRSGEDGADAPRVEPAKTDATLSPEAGGNLLARVLYGVTGWVTGDRKAAVARGDEHKAIASTFSAFLSFRGVALVGGFALVATVVCYLLDEQRGDSIAEAIKRRFAGKKKPGDDAKPAVPTAAPAASAAPRSSAPEIIVFPE